MTDPLIKEAARFAAAAHGAIDQRRKYTFKPYIVHPAEVARLLWLTGERDPRVLAAAWLHDVVEDTPVTLEQVRQAFGEPVATWVDELTDKATPEMGTRTARKAYERARLATISLPAKTIKLADMLSNARQIAVLDPKFAPVYLHEKALALTEALYLPEHSLWRESARLVVASAQPEKPAWRWLQGPLLERLSRA